MPRIRIKSGAETGRIYTVSVIEAQNAAATGYAEVLPDAPEQIPVVRPRWPGAEPEPDSVTHADVGHQPQPAPAQDRATADAPKRRGGRPRKEA